MGTIFPLFYLKGNTPVRRACLKIISNGTKIESHIFLAWEYLSYHVHGLRLNQDFERFFQYLWLKM